MWLRGGFPSPFTFARQPVLVTRDLAGFRQNRYFGMRKDLEGPYSKLWMAGNMGLERFVERALQRSWDTDHQSVVIEAVRTPATRKSSP